MHASTRPRRDFSNLLLHRAPIPEEEPLPGEEPIPDDDPAPHPDPVIREPDAVPPVPLQAQPKS